jgi:hypothetical protein
LKPPARSIRTEVSEAVVAGIRQRGSEAVGLVLVGVARLVLVAVTLLVFGLFGADFFDLGPFGLLH